MVRDTNASRTDMTGLGREKTVRSWWLERVFGLSGAENLILCFALQPSLMLYVVPVIKADWYSGAARQLQCPGSGPSA